MMTQTNNLKQRIQTGLLTVAILTQNLAPVMADPCGMVPPINLVGGQIIRTGVQQTYVFYANGMESIVLRPAFEGNVEEFGMLIPFPTPPAIRKVDDDIFGHIAAAADPPVIQYYHWGIRDELFSVGAKSSVTRSSGLRLKKKDVVVLSEEAVGMYEVAVLEAGSAAALQLWMDQHGFRYPEGMDKPCEEYVEDGWCFVAVKTKVGRKAGAAARPGMRAVDTSLPAGSSFDGHVQAMGFRFATEELVVPMRLSVFNGGDPHNRVYVLTDGPVRIAGLSTDRVVRQVSGATLISNLRQPLPWQMVGGDDVELSKDQLKELAKLRDPRAHNGFALELFTSDLLAGHTMRLSLPSEAREKRLLAIGERLGLRGSAIDALHHDVLAKNYERQIAAAIEDLRGMTLSIIDGEFPKELIAAANLRFEPYVLESTRNDRRHYDALIGRENPRFEAGFGGTLRGPLDGGRLGQILMLAAGLAGLCYVLRKQETRRACATIGALLLVLQVAPRAAAEPRQDGQDELSKGPSGFHPGRPFHPSGEQESLEQLMARLHQPGKAAQAAAGLIAAGKQAIRPLVQLARAGLDLEARGWAIICLTEIDDAGADSPLLQLSEDAEAPALVRTWAAAGRVARCRNAAELTRTTSLLMRMPALERPLAEAWLALLATTGDPAIVGALKATTIAPALQSKLLPAIIQRGPAPLALVLAHAGDDQVRRMAAACLATQGADADWRALVPRKVIETFTFKGNAEQVPWAGGALFIPGLQWSKEDARSLVEELLSWMLWCEKHGLKNQQKQLHNNLRSLQLASAAGYKSPAWQEISTDAWMTLWGCTVGRDGLMDLLARVGLRDDLHYLRIWSQVPKTVGG